MDDYFLHRSQEEEEVLAEIKRALNIEDAKPPPTTISFHSSSTSSSTNVMTSLQSDKDNVPVLSKEPASMDRTSVTESYDDNELTRRSTTSMEGTFSGGAFDSNASSPRFYIGNGVTGEDENGDEGEFSVKSRVSLVEAEEMSYNELLALIERLYDHLKQADEALTKEQARRGAREKSMIKLAKELKNRKATIAECMEQLEELEEELQVARSERALLEQRLDTYMEYRQRRKDESREALDFALAEAEEKYQTACLEHELKIKEMNRSHAEQCEQLCLEVIQANREVVRLQMGIAGMSRIGGVHDGVGSDRGWPSTNSSHRSTRKSTWRRNGIILLATILVFIFAFGHSGYLTMNKMHSPVVWNEVEEYGAKLVKPFVVLPFLQPISPTNCYRSAHSSAEIGSRINLGPVQGIAVPGVKDDPTLRPTKAHLSVHGPAKIRDNAHQFRSIVLKLIYRLKRLLNFIKNIVRNSPSRKQTID